MYELKKIGKMFKGKFVVTGPSFYEKRIYRAAVSQRLRNTVLDDLWISQSSSVVIICGNAPNSRVQLKSDGAR
jgi:hypothetical protein